MSAVASGDPIRVLHVDDEPDFVSLTRIQVERIDSEIRVSGVDTVEAALAELGETDCVVTDYRMPTTDGLAFLEEIRRRRGTVPVVFFTARGSEEIAAEALRAGTTEYLMKGGPKQFEVLVGRVRTLVEAHRATAAAADAERRMADLLANITDPVVGLDDGWQIAWTNPAGEELLGDAISELTDRSLWAFVDEQSNVGTTLRAAAEENESTTVEVYDERRERWFALVTYPTTDGLTVMLRDITTRRAVEERLEATESKLDSTVEQFQTFKQIHSRPEPAFR